MNESCTIKINKGAALTCSVELPALRVRVHKGPEAGKRASLSLRVVRIGSSAENDLQLRDPKVSRLHAELRLESEGIRIVDVGSANGVWVAGMQIKDGVLPPGAKVQLGDSELTFEVGVEERTSFVVDEPGLGELVGRSPRMREIYGVLQAVAPTHATVLVLGESGTGKELVARTLHKLSGRSGSLEIFDASSADPEMIRSDLFGHKKGAFTGAENPRDGAFRKADKGTLFLDEIGELPKELQARLLRVLESREVTPLGSDERLPVDVRIVAATNRDLENESRAGGFRLDLFHRLSVVPVRMPALRERIEDLPLLVDHFVRQLGLACRFPDATLMAMRAYSWPGNVRELRNVVERCGALAGARDITPEELNLPRAPGAVAAGAVIGSGVPPARPGAAPEAKSAGSMEEVERSAILAALERCGGNREKAAKELGISPATLYRRLKDYREKG